VVKGVALVPFFGLPTAFLIVMNSPTY